MPHPRLPLTAAQRQEFAALLLLHRGIAWREKLHLSLLEKEEALLEPWLKYMSLQGLIEPDAQNFYCPTSKGETAYQKLVTQQLSYQTHLEIYSHVDLVEGVFADKEHDLLEDARWSDLRVAVAEFKGIDPYRLVWGTLLTDPEFVNQPNWRFDLAVGKLFDDVERMVNQQISVEDLGYESEQGWIEGEQVLQDVIEQGARLNQERASQQRTKEAASNPAQRDEIVTTIHQVYPGGYYAYDAYSPWAFVGAYAASALFVEALWHDPFW